MAKKEQNNVKKRPIPYHIKRMIVVGLALVLLGLLYFFRNFNYLVLTGSAILFVVLFHLIDYMFDLKFRARHYIFIAFIAIASFLLYSLYVLYPLYDKLLHFLQPVLFSSIVYHMTHNLHLKNKWRLTFVFFVVIGGVGLFEIAEYTLDYFFNLDLQGVSVLSSQGLELIQDPLNDTMIDMALGVLGALLYLVSTATSLYFRKR